MVTVMVRNTVMAMVNIMVMDTAMGMVLRRRIRKIKMKNNIRYEERESRLQTKTDSTVCI